jgi:hypothetical protein
MFFVEVVGTNANSRLQFDLGTRPPTGAMIDSDTGKFTWTPTEAQGPDVFTIPVNVTDVGNLGANACGYVTITVNEATKAPVLMDPSRTIGAGQTVSWNLCGTMRTCRRMH